MPRPKGSKNKPSGVLKSTKTVSAAPSTTITEISKKLKEEKSKSRKEAEKVTERKGSHISTGLIAPKDAPKSTEVVYCGGGLSPDERETAISWLESDKKCEITTSSGKWMKRLEKLGYIPDAINVFDNCEIRFYIVPRKVIGMPRDIIAAKNRGAHLKKNASEEEVESDD